MNQNRNNSVKDYSFHPPSENLPTGKNDLAFDRKRDNKVLLMAVCLVLFASIIVLMPRGTILQQYQDMEEQQMKRNADILQYAFLAELDSLDAMCLEWANWDDTYMFMKDRNVEHLQSNIKSSALTGKTGINLIYLIDGQGEVVWGGQSNEVADKKNPAGLVYDGELVKDLKQIGVAPYRGVLVTAGSGPVLISAHMIYPSSGSGISRGMLILGRQLNQELVDKWSHQTQLDIKIKCEGQETYTPAEEILLQKLQQNSLLVEKLNDNEPRAYLAIYDLRGEPLLASFAWSGELLAQGKKAADYAYGVFVGAIFVVAAGFFFYFYLYRGQVRRNRKEMEMELERRSRELARSEERYGRLVEEAEDAIYIYDLNYGFINANKKALERLEYTSEELADTGILRIIDPQWRQNAQNQIGRLNENNGVQYESLHTRKDGNTVPVEVSAQLIEYDGKPAIMSVVRDISARKRAEGALKASELMYRIIFENSPVGIVYIDRDYRAVSTNQHMRRIFSAEPCQSLTGQVITAPAIGEEMMGLLQRARSGEKTSFEGEYYPPWGGPALSLKILFHPVCPQEAPSEVICLFEDISVRRRNEELLRQLYTAIEQSPVSVVICDKEGGIQYCNENYTRITGFSFEELAGSSPDILQADSNEARNYEQIETCIGEGKSWKGEFCNRRKNGEVFWERAVVSPVYDYQGNFINYVGVQEDITEDKLIEEANRFISSLDMSQHSSENLFVSSLEEALRLSASKIGLIIVPEADGKTVTLFSSYSPQGRQYALNNTEGKQMLHWLKELEVHCSRYGEPLLLNTEADMSNIKFPQAHEKIQRMMVIPISLYRGQVTAVCIVANKETQYTKTDASVVSYFAEKAWTTARRQQTEKALKQSQERARKIFDSVQTGIVLIDAKNSEIVDANPAALELYGGSLGDITGRNCHEILCRDEQVGCPVLNQHLQKDSSERILIRRDGNSIPVLKTVTRLSMGNEEYYLESFVDLSERKAMEEEIRQAMEAAQTAYKAKSMILANMSHEIRTPMNVILGYVQLIKRDPLIPVGQHANLDIINRSGQHLLTVINDILEMARIEAGHASLNEQSCDFELLLNDIENMFRFRCQEKGLVLIFERTDSLPGVLIIDESKVRQVMVNIIGNAVKYTDTGSVTVRVQHTIEPPNGTEQGELHNDREAWVRIIIDVEDSGCGIAAEETDMVFESFERGGNSKYKESGTGLGLAISREYARLLRGDLQLLRSEVNRGSLFGFTFAARCGVKCWIKEEPNRLLQVEAIDGGNVQWRVLVVDDSYDNRAWLMQMLLSIGFDVHKARNGEEGIREAENWQPHVILMDLTMPGLDGYETIHRLKANPEAARIPIIAISASMMEETTLRAHKAGADAYLCKPLREEEVLQVIRQLTGLEYIYENDKVVGNEPDGLEDIQLCHKLCREDIDAMITAVKRGDTKELRNLLNKAEGDDQGVIARLRKLAEEYDYAGLMKDLMRMIKKEYSQEDYTA